MKHSFKIQLIFIVIAGFFATLAFFFIPAKQKKFEANIYESIFRENTSHTQYFNADNDKFIEKAVLSSWNNNKAIQLNIIDHNNFFLHSQLIPFQQIPIISQAPTVFELSKTKSVSLAFISEKNDSIFLNITSIHFPHKLIYIDKIPPSEKANGYTHQFIEFKDVNNDGYKEVYLYISEGFRLRPRKIYCVDIINEQILFTSDEIGAFPESVISLETSKGLQFIMGTQATGFFEADESTKITDQHSYLLFFDEKLMQNQSPIQLADEFSFVSLFYTKNRHKIYAFVSHSNENDLRPAILELDTNMKITNKIDLKNRINPEYENVFLKEDKSHVSICFTNDKKKLVQYNIPTKQENEIKLQTINSPIFAFKTDINDDGNTEYIFRDIQSNNYAITDQNLSNEALFTVPVKQLPLTNFKKMSDNEKKAIVCEGKNALLFINYKPNSHYWIWNIIHFMLIFLFFLLIINFIKAISNQMLKKQIAMKAQIQELQFQSLRNQMSPHFTLNTLNLVANSILNGDKHEAYENFTNFTSLIHNMLSESNLQLKTLANEIDFTRNYLELQKKRFVNRFSYLIQISPEINAQLLVPPLVIQSFAENAIKHAFRNVESGFLKINIRKRKSGIIIDILDNGIGRKAANQHKIQSTGIGNTLMTKYFELLNSTNARQIKFRIRDLYEHNMASGTQVIIYIPYGLKQIK